MIKESLKNACTIVMVATVVLFFLIGTLNVLGVLGWNTRSRYRQTPTGTLHR